MENNIAKKKIRLSLKNSRKSFKDKVNFNEMLALKKKRERGNSSDCQYEDTSSIKDRKRQFRYLRKLNDQNYRINVEEDNSSNYLSDDTLEWVSENLDLVKSNFKFYEDFKIRGREYLDSEEYSNVKICDEISPDVAGEIYEYCENPHENEELFSVMKAYFNLWDCEGEIFERGLGKVRYEFFRTELEKIDTLYGSYENQPKEENVYLTAPMRCMTYYIHNPSKLHKRYIKVEKMRSERCQMGKNSTQINNITLFKK
jgi:hypothetical protein